MGKAAHMDLFLLVMELAKQGGTRINSSETDHDYEGRHVYFFTSDALSVIISTGEPYSTFEKLILPFDNETWMLVILFFVIGMVIILIAEQNKWREFIIGRNVRYPIFNMFIAFFGQGQNILPGRNFAKYMLMMFILFCLIIRTG